MGGSDDGGGIDAYKEAWVAPERKKWASDRTDQLHFIARVLAHGLLDSKFVDFGAFSSKTLFLSRFSFRSQSSWRLVPDFDRHGRTNSYNITKSPELAPMTELYVHGEGAQYVYSSPQLSVPDQLENLTQDYEIHFVDRAVRVALGFVERNVDLETRIQLATPRGTGCS